MEEVEMSRSPNPRKKRSPWKIAAYASAAIVVVIMLAGVLLILFLPDIMVKTVVKARIVREFAEAYPAYAIRIGGIHYSVQENRIGFDSVALTTMDSTLSCSIAGYSISGVGWLELLWARGLVPSGFTGTALDAHGIVVTFSPEQYELRCALLRVSVPDSEVVVEGLTLQPVGDDEQFFAGSKFRKTRFRLVVPHASVTGLACLDLLQGKSYRTRSAHIRDPFIDVLINKEKAFPRETASPPMPNEMFALIESNIEVDSLNIWNGGLTYGERFTAGSKPAVITWDSVQVSVRGIDNSSDAGDTVVIRARGEFMKSAEMNLLMSIPISSSEFSFQYSGSLSRMNLTTLNPFVEIADETRFKSGVLRSATFDIHVISGCAGGSVRAVYNNLTLAVINRRTGSEEGILDVLVSFVANNIKLRTSNVPDNNGAMKIGKVAYSRRRDDPFFGFVWFALRSGVKDVAGF